LNEKSIAEPSMAADSGTPPGCFLFAVGPERLHSAFGNHTRMKWLAIYGAFSAALISGCGTAIRGSSVNDVDKKEIGLAVFTHMVIHADDRG